jgi:hypothetical protein
MRETRNAYRILVEKLLGKRVLGRARRRRQVDVKNDFEIGCEDRRWIKPAQDLMQWRNLVLFVLSLRVKVP